MFCCYKSRYLKSKVLQFSFYLMYVVSFYRKLFSFFIRHLTCKFHFTSSKDLSRMTIIIIRTFQFKQVKWKNSLGTKNPTYQQTQELVIHTYKYVSHQVYEYQRNLSINHIRISCRKKNL